MRNWTRRKSSRRQVHRCLAYSSINIKDDHHYLLWMGFPICLAMSSSTSFLITGMYPSSSAILWGIFISVFCISDPMLLYFLFVDNLFLFGNVLDFFSNCLIFVTLYIYFNKEQWIVSSRKKRQSYGRINKRSGSLIELRYFQHWCDIIWHTNKTRKLLEEHIDEKVAKILKNYLFGIRTPCEIWNVGQEPPLILIFHETIKNFSNLSSTNCINRSYSFKILT